MRTMITTACILLATTTTPLLADTDWLVDYDTAVTESESTGKPILVNFTGSDWCGWCIKLHKEVFKKQEFKTWAAKNVVLLELDFPRRKEQTAEIKAQNKKLKKKYAIRGFPTVLILDAEGNKMGKTGYRRGGPDGWVNNAESMIAAYKKGDGDATGGDSKAEGAVKPPVKKLKGKLISKTDKEVIIETEDGKRIRIPAKNITVKSQ